MKIKTTMFSLALISLLLVSFIAASGVSAPYWEGNALKLAKGESVKVPFNYQNFEGTEDIQVKVIITGGSDIASLEKDTYIIGAQSNAIISVTVSLLKDSATGESKTISLEFKTINTGQSGMVSLGTGQTWSFNVVTQEPIKNPSNMPAILIGIVILVLVLAVIFLFSKKRSKK